MKKNYLLVLPLLFASFLLASCQNKKVDLTYGTYIEKTLFSLKELNNDELEDKLFNQKETLLLAVYQDEYSQDCLCWASFENTLVNYVNTYHEEVYLYNAHEQNKALKELNIKVYEESTPMLYLFNGQKKIVSFSYNNAKDKTVFSDNTGKAMFERLHEYINAPKMYYVDDEYLDDNLSKNDESLVLFMRHTCGDCKYVIPNTLIPYIKSHDIKHEVLVFDLNEYYLKGLVSSQSYTIYDEIKDKYQLTEKTSKEFGYLKGVVPTFHYYQKGVLKDASIYFNDEISKDELGNYYISNSFYSESRLTSIKYTNKSLVGTIIDANNIIVTKSGGYFWAQEKAAKYHDPLLKSFLDMYL